MKQNFYFKHDAPSATNPKLAKLLQKEGARGYGVYWLLIELLRLQTDFSLPVTETAGLVSRLGYTQKTVVVRVIENYDLFSEENGMFFSVGLIKRMENFLSKRDEMSKELGGSLEDNALIINSRFLHNARKEEQRREEQENNSLTRERVRGVLSMDEAIALLPSEQVVRRHGTPVGAGSGVRRRSAATAPVVYRLSPSAGRRAHGDRTERCQTAVHVLDEIR